MILFGRYIRCNDIRFDASKTRRKDGNYEHTGDTANRNLYLEYRPGPLRGRVQVKHMMVSNVKGQFTSVAGVLSLDETDVTNSSVEASVEAASINTRDEPRDAHLESADFFDQRSYP